ncbi:hypothetical protein PAXINDRAFT_94969 [Paxillus involutus ATCC 200175]|nr:hypothetical protein PAXINDRAFT_94969 [Paxillus involutus ATCC 200175]
MSAQKVQEDPIDRKLAIMEAQRDGMFAGLTSALTGALLGSKLMGFNRNKAIFCGVLTGVLSGYFFTQAFIASNISRVKIQQQTPLDAAGEKSPAS